MHVISDPFAAAVELVNGWAVDYQPGDGTRYELRILYPKGAVHTSSALGLGVFSLGSPRLLRLDRVPSWPNAMPVTVDNIAELAPSIGTLVTPTTDDLPWIEVDPTRADSATPKVRPGQWLIWGSMPRCVGDHQIRSEFAATADREIEVRGLQWWITTGNLPRGSWAALRPLLAALGAAQGGLEYHARDARREGAYRIGVNESGVAAAELIDDARLGRLVRHGLHASGRLIAPPDQPTTPDQGVAKSLTAWLASQDGIEDDLPCEIVGADGAGPLHVPLGLLRQLAAFGGLR